MKRVYLRFITILMVGLLLTSTFNTNCFAIDELEFVTEISKLEISGTNITFGGSNNNIVQHSSAYSEYVNKIAPSAACKVSYVGGGGPSGQDNIKIALGADVSAGEGGMAFKVIGDSAINHPIAIVSYDIKVPANKFSVGLSIVSDDEPQNASARLTDNNTAMTRHYFNRAGYFVAKSDASIINKQQAYTNTDEYITNTESYIPYVGGNQWHNVKIVINRERNTSETYFDGTLMKFSNGSSLGGLGQTVSKNIAYITFYRPWYSNFSPSLYAEASAIEIANLRVGYPKEDKKIVKFVVGNNKDLNSVNPASVNAIAYFTTVADSETAENIENVIIKDENGNLVEISDCELSEDKINLLISFAHPLKADTKYFVCIDGIYDEFKSEFIEKFETEFTTNSDVEFNLATFELLNQDGEKITDISEIIQGDKINYNVEIINTLLTDKRIIPILAIYNNGAMTAASYDNLLVEGGTKVVSIGDEIEIVNTDGLEVCLFLLELEGNKFTVYECLDLLRNEEINIDWPVKIGQNLNIKDKDTDVLICVTPKEADIFDFLETPCSEFNKSLVYIGHKKADSNAYIEKDFVIYDDINKDYDAQPGFYNTFLFTDSEEKYIQGSVLYVNKERCKRALNLIKNATTPKQIEDVFNGQNEAAGLGIIDLFIDYSFADQIVNTDAVVNLVLNSNREEITMDDDKLELECGIVKRAFVTVAISEGLVNNIYDYIEELKINDDSSSLKNWHDKSYATEKFKHELVNRMKECSVSDYESFDKKLLECFILSVVRYSDGVKNIKDILNEFHNVIGVSKNAKESAYDAIKGKDYSNYSELVYAFEKASESNNNMGGGLGGAGGSSGSVGGNANYSSALSPITVDKEEPAKVEELPANIFNDIEDVDWAKEAIVDLAEQGIINGYDNGLFKPNKSITRAEFVKMIVTAFNISSDNADINFVDVNDADWYAPYVKIAYSTGIVNGYSSSLFGVNDNITRQDMAVIIVRTFEYLGIQLTDLGASEFFDSNTISDYAVSAVNILHSRGIINGVGSNNFNPHDFATRAAVAKVIYGVMGI